MSAPPYPTSYPASYQALDHDILCIDTEQVRPGMSCCYLVRGGDEYAFIECGTPHCAPNLFEVLARENIAPEQVRYIMPTHVHLDHAAGAGALMKTFPNAQLAVHPRGARHLIDPSRLIEGATAVYGAARLAQMYGDIEPVPEKRVLQVKDRQQLKLGGRSLELLDAPGHARHHYIIWDERSRGFFTGDVFGLSYREFDGPGGPLLMATTTPVQFEPEAWHDTIERILARKPAWVFLTHYGRLGDVAQRAKDLRADIEAHLQIAREYAASPDRHALLRAALTAHELSRLAQLDSPVSVARATELLQFDMDLNAQGLEVWLEKQTAEKAADR